jgi:A118 family predicted phage portal protein
LFSKLKTFWQNFWGALKTAYNKAFRDVAKDLTQNFRDIKRINFLAIFVSKINNLANIESTYDIESDSVQVERLKELCKDLEAKRFDIVENMLGDGDYWVFPAHDNSGELYHRYITQDRVRVLAMDGEKIVDIIGVIDDVVSSDNKTYFLNRRQTLDGDSLVIETYTTNERNEKAYIEEWAELESVYRLTGVDNIGVGRFKSPASSRGMSVVYGVPLNFGCEEIEQKIFNDLDMIESEFKNGESKIFADPLVLRKGKDKVGNDAWQIPENVFPIDTRGGTAGANIDIFSPAIRYSEYQSKLIDDMKQYEQQVGTDRGFLTPLETGMATATEIRRANASTIALIDKVHTAIKNGVEETLKADALFLNIADDLYSVKVDFYDAFEDSDAQYQRIASAVDRGVAEKSDEIQWLFPNLTQEEIDEKLARISTEEKINQDIALEKILNGG